MTSRAGLKEGHLFWIQGIGWVRFPRSRPTGETNNDYLNHIGICPRSSVEEHRSTEPRVGSSNLSAGAMQYVLRSSNSRTP